MTFLFWFFLLLIVYTYAGYPLLALLLAQLSARRVVKNEILPRVSVLIAAYNEAECIGATIENKLSLEYPADKLEILVVSDESTDGTDEIVGSYRNLGVRLIRQEPRAGKTSALNLAVPLAEGEILVFSDANSIYAPDAISALVRNFCDPDVGYVTGKMIYTNPDGTVVGDGCSAYMKYENWLREIETALGSVVGVDGGIDAMRKELYTTLNADQLPDFVQPLKVVEKGFRVVYEPSALLREAALKQSRDEYRMRVRVTLRALWALHDMRGLLLGKAGLLFAWQLWSHKVLRYFCFIFLLFALFSNICLLGTSAVYAVLLFGQVLCYAAALLSPICDRLGRSWFFPRLCYYFVLLNIASLHAAIKFFLGKKQVVWSPRKG